MAFIPLADLQPEPDLHPRGALDERRRYPRLPVRALMLYAGNRGYVGRGDISAGGAFWLGDGTLEMLGPVELGITLPGLEREVRVPALVCHLRHAGGMTGVHVRFAQLPREALEAITRYVDDWFLIADASGLLVA
jgi:PilZ domain